jgi:hypothetical protein
VSGPALENAVIEKLRSALTKDYLLDLAREFVQAGSGEATSKNEAEALRRRLGALEAQAERIILNFGEGDHASTAMSALDKIQQEQVEVGRQLTDIEQRAKLQVEWATIEEQIEGLVSTATRRLANPSEELAELVDLVELDLVRVGDHRYEGTASIPLLPGEVCAEGPQRLSPHRPRSGRAASPR